MDSDITEQLIDTQRTCLELTETVTALQTELEKERSHSHALKVELEKYQTHATKVEAEKSSKTDRHKVRDDVKTVGINRKQTAHLIQYLYTHYMHIKYNISKLYIFNKNTGNIAH